MNKIVTRLRQRWLLQKLAYTLLIGICLGLAAYWMTKWIVWPLAAVTLMMGFAALVFSRSRQYQDITANKVLLHLNRQFSECEESAELVLLPSGSLTTLQQLQKTRIQPQIDTLLSTELGSHLPKYSCKSALLLSALAVLIFTLIEVLPLDLLLKAETANTRLINEAPKQSKLIRLETKSMTVTPPSYTGLTAWQTTDLNLELIAGSTVTWQFQLIGINNVNQ